nr:hypothetical protein [Leifsonia psychrotolerans]
MHKLPDRGSVDRLRGGDKLDAAFLKISHDDGVVDAVARETGELVDDDVIDVAVAADALQHLLESDTFGHLSGGAPRLDVLGNDGDAELVSFALAGHALGWDGDTFGVVVRVDLPLG